MNREKFIKKWAQCLPCDINSVDFIKDLDSLLEQQKPVLSDVNAFVEQLDKWIADCQLQANGFSELSMETSESCSLAMKTAYMNAREYLTKN